MQRRLNLPLVDTLWLIALCLYALAGMMIVPFHPDETEHIRISQDYANIFLDGNVKLVETVVDPATGLVLPGDPTIRLQEGPLHSYVTGLIWHLAGMTPADLPPAWNWGEDFAANVAAGRLPSVAMLAAGRFASTLFFCVSILAIYGLGRLFGNRVLALVVSGLYALNPMLLMHARRAMLEGPLLGLALVTLLVAGVISTRKPGERLAGWWWAALAVAGGVGMTTKYTFAFTFAAALGWVFLSGVLAWIQARHLADWRTLLRLVGRVVVVGIAALVIFIGLTPTLWSNPAARLIDALNIVQAILASQVRDYFASALSLAQRFQIAVDITFLTPIEPGHTAQETLRYGASLYHGVNFPYAVGLLLSGLAAFGLIAALLMPLAFPPGKPGGALRIGLLMWLGASALLAAQTPVPWQRYYVTFVPLAVLLAGIGLLSVIRMIAWVLQSRPITSLRRIQPQ